MDKDKFNSHNKTGKARYSLLRKFEKQLVTHFVPHVGSFFETYELTWLTLLWSIAVVICSYFAKSNILWLNGVSAAIILHYITDLFDGAVGRSKKTGLVKWGFYMDHFFDYVFLCSLMIGYSFLLDQRYSYLFIFLLALFAGYMINSFLEFSATNYFRISYFGVSPTEINVLFVILNTCVIFFGTAILLSILPYLILGSFFVLAFIVYRTQKNIWRRDMVAKKESTKEEKRAIRLKYKYFRRKYVISLLIFLFFYLNFYVFITNPFNSWSIIKNPFTTTVENNQIVLHQSFSVNVEENIFQKAFAFYKSGVHIFANAYIGSKKAPSSTVAGIIADIHKLRFDPTKPYLISGDQFSVFYPRNLGVFYSALLNPNTALNKTDWENKERLYLQTTAYALDAFANADTIFTTIVPIGFHSVTGINIYAYPSDSLYGVLYALQQMQNLHNNNATYHLQTVAASQELLYSYHDNLQSLLKKYEQTVFDTKTGLVKKNIHLSSARDSVIRESAFYDNVIYWKTLQLASSLGVTQINQSYLDDLKTRILKTFWYAKGGYFLNDLSGSSLQNKTYSSDWLIVLPTAFISPSVPTEEKYFQESATYIEKNKLDQPFPLRYQLTLAKNDEFSPVAIFVPEYGQNAIWSYWGTEYIKVLLGLYQQTKNPLYLQRADIFIAKYKQNIVVNKGFPEVYDSKGNYLQNFFYKSIRQTGWVVDFEDVLYLRSLLR